MSDEPALSPEVEALIGGLIDGRLEAAQVTALAGLAHADPAIRRVLRDHLLISEISSQLLAPERGGEAFFSGLLQRHHSELDAEVFTRRVLHSIASQRAQALRGTARFILEVASLSAAALLMLGLLSLSAYALVRVGAQKGSAATTVSHDAVLRPLDLASLLARKDMQ
jgi:hypothetical protein